VHFGDHAVKPHHLILIVLIGISLIAASPAPQKDKTEAAPAPAQTVKAVPSQDAKVKRSSFAGDVQMLKKP
jgi:hypothetical protein